MKKIIYIIFVVLVFTAIAATGLFFWAKSEITRPMDAGNTKEVSFVVNYGDGVRIISRNLKDQGFIKNKLFFDAYVVYKGFGRKLKAGEYMLAPSMTTIQIVNKLVAGEIVKKQFTILDGWDLLDIANNLEELKIFDSEEIFNLTGLPAKGYIKENDIFENDFSQKFEFLKDKPKNMGLEGYLYPDTYEVGYSEKPEETINKILANFDKKLAKELRDEIAKQKKTIFEIITIASIIEKEVRTTSDKKIVSGILWKRLDANMPLQIDATVNYATGKSKPSVSLNDLAIDSPYNTYKYKGLPIGPISNPGIDSIKAAIYPAKTKYWFYLSAKTGETIFSRTFSEHSIAKEIYLR